jgi:hypothetical protein
MAVTATSHYLGCVISSSPPFKLLQTENGNSEQLDIRLRERGQKVRKMSSRRIRKFIHE